MSIVRDMSQRTKKSSSEAVKISHVLTLQGGQHFKQP